MLLFICLFVFIVRATRDFITREHVKVRGMTCAFVKAWILISISPISSYYLCFHLSIYLFIFVEKWSHSWIVLLIVFLFIMIFCIYYYYYFLHILTRPVLWKSGRKYEKEETGSTLKITLILSIFIFSPIFFSNPVFKYASAFSPSKTTVACLLTGFTNNYFVSICYYPRIAFRSMKRVNVYAH